MERNGSEPRFIVGQSRALNLDIDSSRHAILIILILFFDALDCFLDLLACLDETLEELLRNYAH